MRKRLIILAGVFACALASRFALAQVEVGDKPRLAFKAVGGEQVDLAALRGKLVVIDFWATWCGPCMREAGHMVRLHEEYGNKGLVMIGVSLDDSHADLVRVIKDKRLSWPHYYDAGRNEISSRWGVEGIPETYLIGPDGSVLWKGHPGGGLDDAIADAYQNHPPQLVDPKTLAAAKGLLDQIDKMIEKNDTTGALRALGKFPPAARADGAIDKRVGEVEKKLSKAADALLAAVDPLIDEEKYAEAAGQLQDLVKALAGTPVAARARQKLNELTSKPEAKAAIDAAEKTKRADEALAIAKKLQADKKDEPAYLKFKSIVKDFPTTPAAAPAREAVALYEKDEAFVKRVNENAAAGKAKSILGMAENYKKAGRKDLAKKKYQEVIDQFPDTSFAETARSEVKNL